MLREIYHSRKHWFFIRYFKENNECIPMEIKPVGLTINDYQLLHDHGDIIGVKNLSFHSEVMFFDMTMESKFGYVEGSTLDIWTQIDPKDMA